VCFLPHKHEDVSFELEFKENNSISFCLKRIIKINISTAITRIPHIVILFIITQFLYIINLI
jgi:hypothetical protein